MAHSLVSTALRQLLHRIGPRAGGDVGDGALLDRFCAERDGQAFAELVQRHGPMVLAVCRRVLHNAHEAEDACQATFLVLARNAAALDRQRSLGNWLYTVAHNLALNIRNSAARRRAREREAANMAAQVAAPEPVTDELRDTLDAELSRLPAKYRAPLVLCYLQGKSAATAAQELGWPVGSMAKRLARGKELLRDRLSRRGVSAALLATILADAAQADMPPTLVEQISRAATLFAAAPLGNAALLSRSAGYAAEMLHAMKVKKAKVAALVLGFLGVVGISAGWLVHQVFSDKPQATVALVEGASAGHEGDVHAVRTDFTLFLSASVTRNKAGTFEIDKLDYAPHFGPSQFSGLEKSVFRVELIDRAGKKSVFFDEVACSSLPGDDVMRNGTHGIPRDARMASMNALVPMTDAVSKINLYLEGRLLWTMDRPAKLPEVSRVVQTVRGALVTLTWESRLGAGGLPLFYDVAYSPSPGAWDNITPNVIAPARDKNTFEIDLGSLHAPDGKPVPLKMSLTDGFHAVSSEFLSAAAVPKRALEVELVGLPPFPDYIADNAFDVRFYFYHPEDGSFADDRPYTVSWQLDGKPVEPEVVDSMGAVFRTAEVGKHVLKMTVRHNKLSDRSAERKLEFRIKPPDPEPEPPKPGF